MPMSRLPCSRRDALARSAVVLAGLAAGACPGPARAQLPGLNEAINEAGRERMSQRLAKCWLARAMAVEADLAARTLAGSLERFERQLADLTAYAPQPAVRGTYAQLGQAWAAYKATLAAAAPDRVHAGEVLADAGRVLQLAHLGTTQLEALSGQPAGRWVNLAGRQRMLSQRLAALAFAAAWGVQVAENRGEIVRARAEFTAAHAQLMAAPEATPAIRADLQLAQVQWTFLDRALDALGDATAAGAPPREHLGHVFTTSERILEVMDGVTGQFARLS